MMYGLLIGLIMASVWCGMQVVMIIYLLQEQKRKKLIEAYLLQLDEREMRRYIQELGLP